MRKECNKKRKISCIQLFLAQIFKVKITYPKGYIESLSKTFFVVSDIQIWY